MDRPRGRDQEPAKEAPGRIGERQSNIRHRWVERLFLTGNRFTVASGLLFGIFCVLSGTVILLAGPRRHPSPLFYVFGGLIGGNLTLITVVISINQLVLSRELGTPGEIAEQMQEMTDYRQEIARTTGREVVPYLPPDFMYLLLETTRHRVRRLHDTVDPADGALHEEVDALVAAVTAHVDRAMDLIDRQDARPFEALATTLNANYAAFIHDAERIRATHASTLPDATDENLGELADLFRNLDVAREYFKTLFLQEELAYLSRVLFYVGIPAELASVVVLVLFATTPSGAFPIPGFPFLVPLVVTIGFAPLAVLFAFVLRIATVTQHTAPIVPFAMPGREP